jgi:sugar phosphate isomerase/epimerase
MKVGVADYGMNVWEGGHFDTEDRLARLKQIGYEGLERCEAATEAEALYRAAGFRRQGMDFATCRGPSVELSIQWTAALGKPYVWTAVGGNDFDTFCRQVNRQVEAAAAWGVKVGLHNHLHSLVETQEQLDRFMARCSGCGLILDTAHLAAAQGDPVGTVRRFGRRIVSMHLKDWIAAPDADRSDPLWYRKGRFCELGAGNIGLDNAAVVKALRDVGYDGWLFVEQDTHLQDTFRDLAISRDYLRKAGV